MKKIFTRCQEEDMMREAVGRGPASLEGDDHEHQSLGVKGSPTDEENKNDGGCENK